MEVLGIYADIFINGYKGYGSYLWYEISHPSWHNYFYALIFVSLFFLLLEWFRPWREDQAKFRKDFWLDFFYMFFNFFLFSLIIYNAASDVVVNLFNNWIKSGFGIDLQALNPMHTWPLWAVLIVGFVVRDFVQWWTHRLLHSVPFLWEFHKVHHSVEQMGFAAHLRYHWMETIVYRSIEYIPLALLGIGLYDFYMIHIFSLFIGHYNHSNLSIDQKWTGMFLGSLIGLMIGTGAYEIKLIEDPGIFIILTIFMAGGLGGYFVISRIIKKLFNNPEMHIWHHAYHLPEGRRLGVNFGLSLAIWDYLFSTAYIPYNAKQIRLGFPGVEKYPHSFLGQMSHGFSKRKS